jgi:hypothetical protein
VTCEGDYNHLQLNYLLEVQVIWTGDCKRPLVEHLTG